MIDGTANLKGRKCTELKISHFNHFCASLSPAIHPILAPIVGSQRVQDTLSPITEQVFCALKSVSSLDYRRKHDLHNQCLEN